MEGVGRHQLSSKVRYVARELPRVASFATRLGWKSLLSGGSVPAREYARIAGESATGHRLAPEDVAYLESFLADRTTGRLGLWLSFFRLPPEWERRYFPVRTKEALHDARRELVRTELPPAERILDLGGLHPKRREGALLAMGYPHRPRLIWIQEQPNASNWLGLPDGFRHVAEGGTEVRYSFGSMTRLDRFADESFDLVWSGQSIEHVTEEDADRVLAECFRVLRPGGHLCLDTPNRGLTRLLYEGYNHPEHKREYYPHEMREKLEKMGFSTEAALAVTPLELSHRTGRICKLEILRERRVAAPPEVGFSFFLRCRRPV